jgi:DNA-binding MarR family transcriptional regulator
MNNSSSDDSIPAILRRLLLAILLFQRKNGYIFSAWGKLRLVEHQILIELDRSPLIRPVDLSILLHQPPANISHILASLRKKGMVREVEGNSDREKLILLTASGRRITSHLDDLSNHLMNSFSENLSNREQSKIYELWESINDSLGSPRTVISPGDHPLRIQTRRFTRVFGFLSKKPTDSALSYPEIQILYSLSSARDGILLRDLAHILHVPVSTLKKNLAKLHLSGLCSAPTSRRGQAIRICTKGSEFFESTIERIAQRFKGDFSDSLIRKIFDSLPLFERTVANWTPTYAFPSPELYIKTQDSFFAHLQIPYLKEYARRSWGIMPSPMEKRDTPQESILMYRGPTPCFYLNYRNLEGICVWEEFGCAPSTNWAEVGQVLFKALLSASNNPKKVAIYTKAPTVPLRSLLSINSPFKSKISFSDFPPSHY